MQLASKKEDVDEAAQGHVQAAVAVSPVVETEMAGSVSTPLVHRPGSPLSSASDSGSGAARVVDPLSEPSETSSISDRNAAVAAVAAVAAEKGGSGSVPTWQGRPSAPWSKYSVEALEKDVFSGAGLTFKILRAAVLTQPLLIEYFEAPFQLTFL